MRHGSRYRSILPDHHLHGLSRPQTYVHGQFLTVYEMRDLGFTQTTEFHGLEGQNPASPSKDKIFLRTEFDTRYYEKVYVHEAEDAEVGKYWPQFGLSITRSIAPCSKMKWFTAQHVSPLADISVRTLLGPARLLLSIALTHHNDAAYTT